MSHLNNIFTPVS